MQKHALEALLLQTLVELEIPVFVVPRDGMPLAGQVHADLVRAAGLDRHLQQLQRGQARARGTAAARADPGDGGHAVRVGGRGGKCVWRWVSAERFLATSKMPEVSGSSRCTSSRNGASGRAWRSCSITPKLTPLPPCTATPAGLSMAIRCSSSQRMGNSRAGAGCSAFWATVSEMRSGGRRTMSPACTRVSACARPLFIPPLPQAGRHRTCGDTAVGGRFGPYNAFHLRVCYVSG